MRVFIALLIALFNCFLCISEELSIPSCKVSISDKIIRGNQYSCKLKIAAPDGWKFPQPPNISIKNSSDFRDIKKEISCSGKSECIFSISARSPQPRIMKLSIDSPICDKVCVLTNNCVDIDFGERNLLFLYIILGFFGGLILNVMPCVLPVILMKLRAFKSKIGLIGSICGNFASFFCSNCRVSRSKIGRNSRRLGNAFSKHIIFSDYCGSVICIDVVLFRYFSS